MRKGECFTSQISVFQKGCPNIRQTTFTHSSRCRLKPKKNPNFEMLRPPGGVFAPRGGAFSARGVAFRARGGWNFHRGGHDCFYAQLTRRTVPCASYVSGDDDYESIMPPLE